ncbi:hypothetical protein HZC00_03555 [Candidatus Kaiserbacteria bacterium]|nr:hypothetical protein [Candidatus Kaiserbacteria bacterium]
MLLIHRNGSFTSFPFYLFVLVFALISILYTTPAHADITGCPAGTVRKATTEDVSNFQKLNGSNIPLSTCLSQTLLDQLGLNNTGALQSQQELAGFVCPGYKVGYDSTLSAATLKQTNVYFTSPNQGMDPKFLVCAAKFLNAAKAQGLNPCITAALRTVAHQRASCLDTSNTVVCGRKNQCTNFSSCPHVGGIALDIKSQSGRQTELQRLASNMNLIFTLPTTDAVHMQPQSSCRGAGSATTPTQSPSSTTPGSQQPSTTGTPRSPAQDPDIADPSTENPFYPVGGSCQIGYVLYNGQCIPSNSPLTCPLGSTATAVSMDPIDIRCLPTQSQSYCQFGYVFANGQCLPTQCNGSSAYAVYNGQVISCTQQQYNQQCPQGSLMINNQCVPFSQNQNMPQMGGQQPGGMQGGMPPGGGAPTGSQSPSGTVPAGSTQTGGTGTSGQGSTVIDSSQCTPRVACQSGVVYQQTNLCAMQVLQTCQYGCATDGVNCATATSTSSTGTTTGTANTPLSTIPSRILEQIERLTGAGTAAPVPIINSTVLTEADISAIRLQGLGNGTPLSDILPSTFSGSRMIYPNGIPDIFIPINTFEQASPNGFNGIASESYSPSQLTLLQSAFRNIRWTIEGILTYLRIIQQPTPTSL